MSPRRSRLQKNAPLTAASRVLLWIEEYVAANALGVGDALPAELEMAEAVGVGRSSVREALTALKVLGIIQQRRKGGIRIVRDPVLLELRHYFTDVFDSQERYEEALEFRAALEWGFGPLVLARRRSRCLRGLKAILREAESTAPEDFDIFAAEIRFHSILAEVSGNRLARLFAFLYGPIFRQADDGRHGPEYVPEWIEQHRRLVETLAAGEEGDFLEELRAHTHNYMRWPNPPKAGRTR